MTGFEFVLVLMFFSSCQSKTAKFPDNFQRCHRSDPDMDTCLKNAIEAALHSLEIKGIPHLGLTVLEPIDIAEIHIGEGASAVNLVQNYYNVKLHVLKNSKIAKAHMDFEKLVLTFTLQGDFTQTAKYNVTGKVMLLPVYGEGDSTFKFKDATMNMKLVFKEETKNDMNFYIVDECYIELSIGGANYEIEHLFNGQKDLADNFLKVLNDNALDIFEDVKPGVQKAYALIFKDLAKKVFDKVPADEIFQQ